MTRFLPPHPFPHLPSGVLRRVLAPAFRMMSVCAIWLAVSLPAHAALEIDITQGNVDPLPIAITDLVGEGSLRKIGEDISRVISADLERSGLFRPIDPAAFIQQSVPDLAPRFGDWRIINALALVTGRVSPGDDFQRVRVEFRLWDVLAEQQAAGLQFQAEPENWRRIAHLIADQIYQRLTGEGGYFDTRIVYVAESGPKDARIKQLAIMDQDGHDPRPLTDGSILVLTPRFSPTAQEITYMAYENRTPHVYLLDIDSGRREVVGTFPGMTFSPRFAPDGQKIVMSLQEGANSNIHVMDLRTRETRALTNTAAIDTAPSFSPDGSRITFESDRGGSQQIYVMNADGSGLRRISFGDGRYATPVWSPRGDLIAFTKQYRGQFLIGVMRPDGSGERILTSGFHNEGPSWSPNGRVLMFFREIQGIDGGPQLWSVDLTGYNERPVRTPTFASDPAWSPLIQ